MKLKINILEKEPKLETKDEFEFKLEEFTCWAVASNQIDNIYVSYISKNKDQCNIGKSKIVLEKLIGRKNNG